MGEISQLVTVVVSAKPCPDLVLGPNMTAPTLSAVVGDPPLTVTCDAGFVIDSVTQTLTKELFCIDMFVSFGKWSSTVDPCVRKY
jgi:hypothetical protein